MICTKTCNHYRTCFDLLCAFGLIVSIVVGLTLGYIISKSWLEAEVLPTEYIVQLSLGLTIGLTVFISSVTYLCIQYRGKRVNEADLESRKLKTVVILEGEDCAICHGKMDTRDGSIVSLSCEHEFHKPCAQKWINKPQDTKCPLCRQTARSFTKKEKKIATEKERQFLKSQT